MTTKELTQVIAENVRARRREKDMTQRELAERLDMTQAFVSQIETGVRDVSASTLCDLANALGCTVAALVTEKSFVEVA